MGRHKHLPLPTGHETVGCIDFMRDAAHGGGLVRFFYPTEPSDIKERKSLWPLWVPRVEYAMAYARLLRRGKYILQRLFKALAKELYIPAIWQGPVKRPSHKRYPVIVFSHGMGGNRTCYTTLCLELASRGFVVAVVEHRDGSANVTLKLREAQSTDDYGVKQNTQRSVKRRSLRRCKSMIAPPITRDTTGCVEEWHKFEHYKDVFDFTIRNRQLKQRVSEVSQALDLLTELNNGSSSLNMLGYPWDASGLKGSLDLESVSVVGHSFGGATAVAVLAQDKRFSVGVALDAWMLPLHAHTYAHVNSPLLFVNNWTFQTASNVSEMTWLLGTRHTSLLTLRGTCHQSQTDFQFVLSPLLSRLAKMRNKLDPHLAIELQIKAITGFINKHCGLPGELHEDVLLATNTNVISGTNRQLEHDHTLTCPWTRVSSSHTCLKSSPSAVCRNYEFTPETATLHNSNTTPDLKTLTQQNNKSGCSSDNNNISTSPEITPASSPQAVVASSPDSPDVGRMWSIRLKRNTAGALTRQKRAIDDDDDGVGVMPNRSQSSWSLPLSAAA